MSGSPSSSVTINYTVDSLCLANSRPEIKRPTSPPCRHSQPLSVDSELPHLDQANKRKKESLNLFTHRNFLQSISLQFMSYFNTDGKEQWGQKCQDQFCSHGRKSHIDDSAAAAAAKSLQSCSILCDPIDGSPPRFPRPWDSPGKNTGVGCHFLLHCIKVKSESAAA